MALQAQRRKQINVLLTEQQQARFARHHGASRRVAGDVATSGAAMKNKKPSSRS